MEARFTDLWITPGTLDLGAPDADGDLAWLTPNLNGAQWSNWVNSKALNAVTDVFPPCTSHHHQLPALPLRRHPPLSSRGGTREAGLIQGDRRLDLGGKLKQLPNRSSEFRPT